MTIQSLISYIKANKKRSTIIAVVAFFIIMMILRAGGGPSTGADQASDTRVSLLSIAEMNDDQSVVQATGEVESIAQVELRSEVAARIVSVPVNIGDTVRRGQVLVRFDGAALAAQRNQALASLQAARAGLVQVQAGVTAQEAVLTELTRGPRAEDLAIAEAAAENAENSRMEAENNVELAEQKAIADLDAVHLSALAAAQKAIAVAENGLYNYTNLQHTYFNGGDVNEIEITSNKANAVRILLGQDNAGRWNNSSLSLLTGGAKGAAAFAQQTGDHDHIVSAVDETLAGLQALSLAYSVMPADNDFSAADTTIYTTQKQTVLAEITALTASKNAISQQERVNESAVQGAQTSLVAAQNAVVSAIQQLTKVQAGASVEQIDTQEAQVNQAAAGLQAQQAQVLSAQASLAAANAGLAKTVIRSPIGGTVAVLPSRVGELVSPGQLAASVVNTDGFQITAFINSSELSAVAVGGEVQITETATGTVSRIAPSIDPQTKKVEVTIVVSNPDNSDLVAGQFVDVTISRASAIENPILRLPLQAIRVSNDMSYVYTLNEENMVLEHEVITGRVIGTDIEVLAGLEDLDTVIRSVRGVEAGETVSIRE